MQGLFNIPQDDKQLASTINQLISQLGVSGLHLYYLACEAQRRQLTSQDKESKPAV